MTYGPAGELLTMSVAGPADSYNETRQYNTLYQLTRLTDTITGGSLAPIDFQYSFSATQNNGKITKMKDWVTGEEVNYQYDALNRLASAETTGAGWGQSYVFDGFDNLLQQNVTVDPATNRLSGVSYDAAGNDLSKETYDRLNRLKTASGAAYDYDPWNKRIWKKKPDNSEEYYFYLGRERLGTYSYNTGTNTFSTASTNVYFRSKPIRLAGNTVLTDRAGSNVTSGKRYFPWGQEKPSATANNVEKYTGYFRDAESGLDYAEQRYYQTGAGRFLTADPAQAGLNWYSYTGGDPINRMDPSGLDFCELQYGEIAWCIQDEMCEERTMLPEHESICKGDHIDGTYRGYIDVIEDAEPFPTEYVPLSCGGLCTPIAGDDSGGGGGGGGSSAVDQSCSNGFVWTSSGCTPPSCEAGQQWMYNPLHKVWGCDRPLTEFAETVVDETGGGEILRRIPLVPLHTLICASDSDEEMVQSVLEGARNGAVEGAIVGEIIGPGPAGAFVGGVVGATEGVFEGFGKALICGAIGGYRDMAAPITMIRGRR